MTDDVIRLDLGCVPDAGASGAVLVATGTSAFLTFDAVREAPDGRGGGEAGATATALVELAGCRATRFGHPDAATLLGHPLASKLSGPCAIYEVRESSWRAEQEGRDWRDPSAARSWDCRHFLISLPDATFEALADDLVVDLLEEPYHVAFERISRRILR
jgi:hypothetical protein